VIVILAILAAAALPKYAALQTQARIAKLNGAIGAMQGAAALAHGSCLATQGATPCTAAAFTLSMEGTGITLINQYPTANAAGIIEAAGINLNDPNQQWAITGGGTNGGDQVTLEVRGGVNEAACSVVYTAAQLGAGNTIISPVFSTPNTNGC